MTRLHFASALLPSGWANDVQVVITAGAIAEVTPGVAPASGDERHGIALPGLASLARGQDACAAVSKRHP
jgi:hypothetical protein